MGFVLEQTGREGEAAVARPGAGLVVVAAIVGAVVVAPAPAPALAVRVSVSVAAVEV